MSDKVYKLIDKLIDKKINKAINKVIDERLEKQELDIKILSNKYLILDGQSPLSDREIEVLDLVRKGLKYKEVGGKLYITEATVKNHMCNIRRKLDAKSNIEAVYNFYEKNK